MKWNKKHTIHEQNVDTTKHLSEVNRKNIY